MANYLKLFEDETAYNEFKGSSAYVTPNVSVCSGGGGSIFYNPLEHDYSKDYFTTVARENGTISFSGSTASNTLNYSINGGDWSTASREPSVIVKEGDKVKWRGICTPNSSNGIGKFTNGTATFDVEGNAMSLLFSDNFVGQTSLSGKDYAFRLLFSGNTNVINAENLSLPATTLAQYCYQNMFNSCTSLTTAPKLPATTLVQDCYAWMFWGCTSLTTAPELPATTLADRCYDAMFRDCTSLTSAPELPATALANGCYSYMFYGTNVLPDCSNIDFTSQTVVTSKGLHGLFAGTKVTDNDLGQILPKDNNGKYCLPVTKLAEGCYADMFANCTGLTTAPVLLATTLASQCYFQMFSGTNVLPDCSNIDFTSQRVVASGGLNGLFAGTKVTDSDLEQILPKDNNGKYCLPVTKLADRCYYAMFRDCTSLTTAPELPAIKLANNCYQNMFFNCTSLTSAPVLPATTLASACYNFMFRGCTSLNYIKAMFTTNPYVYGRYIYTNNWVFGVAANGTFVKNSAATWDEKGASGIPDGWIVQTA